MMAVWLLAAAASAVDLRKAGVERQAAWKESLQTWKGKAAAWKQGMEALTRACDVKMSSVPKEAAFGGQWGLVKGEDGAYAFKKDASDAIVRGNYVYRGPPEGERKPTQKGWSDVHMAFNEGQKELTDNQKMFAAGVLEGALTGDEIKDFFENTKLRDGVREGLTEMFMPQIAFLGESVGKGTEFWKQSVAQGCQLLGMHMGYIMAKDSYCKDCPDMNLGDISRLNVDGEVDFLAGLVPHSEAFSFSEHSAIVNMRNETDEDKYSSTRHPELGGGRCSALVRYTGDDLLVGHTTWESYNEQVRNMKRYDFPLEGAKAKSVVFSSYPACISSTDDWVIGDNKVLITETTTSIMNKNHGVIHDKYVPDFIHVMSAFRNSASGKEFVEKFLDAEHAGHSRALTGTYNSEWMIADYNQVQPVGGNRDTNVAFIEGSGTVKGRKKEATMGLGPGALYVMDAGPGISDEEVTKRVNKIKLKSTPSPDPGELKAFVAEHGPLGSDSEVTVVQNEHGSAAYMDATPVLTGSNARGFWASYNEPGLPEMMQIQGYHTDRRKKIFEKVAPSIWNIDDMAKAMRRNNRKDDGVSYSHAIAPRGDLDSAYGNFGGTDSKVMNRALIEDMALVAINGPTAVVDGECKPYAWPRQQPGIEAVMDSPWMRFGVKQESGANVLDTQVPWTENKEQRGACFGARSNTAEARPSGVLDILR